MIKKVTKKYRLEISLYSQYVVLFPRSGCLWLAYHCSIVN